MEAWTKETENNNHIKPAREEWEIIHHLGLLVLSHVQVGQAVFQENKVVKKSTIQLMIPRKAENKLLLSGWVYS